MCHKQQNTVSLKGDMDDFAEYFFKTPLLSAAPQLEAADIDLDLDDYSITPIEYAEMARELAARRHQWRRIKKNVYDFLSWRGVVMTLNSPWQKRIKQIDKHLQQQYELLVALAKYVGGTNA
jgi:hypothetical protein